MKTCKNLYGCLKHLRVFLIFGGALLLSGCPNTYQLNHNSDTQPLAQPINFNRPGPLLHEASGLNFSEVYGNFQRSSAMIFDIAGLDVGFNYNDHWSNCKIIATFYVYPTPRMSFIGAPRDVVTSVSQGWLNDEFDRTKTVTKQVHTSMQSEVVGSVTTPAQGTILNGNSFSYREAGNISELRLFIYDLKWFLKYRFTYPKSCQIEAGPRLEALIQQLPWATTH